MPVNIEKEKRKIPMYLEIRKRWIEGETCRAIAVDYQRPDGKPYSPQWVNDIVRARIKLLVGMPDLSQRGRPDADVQQQVKDY
jgi:hypothetical protein